MIMEPKMGKVERMTVTISAGMAALLRDTVEGGEYASASEIVREALREWTRARETERRDLAALRALVREGDESGPGIPAAEVFADLRRQIGRPRAGDE
jgi:antitoxin ParD1/3/4